MANKIAHNDNKGHPTWTDSFPHDFHGWGPQTPTPDNELPEGAEHIKLRVPDHLTWHGDDRDDHIVWRYDSARH